MINQTGGVATLNMLAGTGTLSVGNASGPTALASLGSLVQGAVTVRSTGTVRVLASTPRITNDVGALSISGNGTLDLNNHELLTDAAPATIKAYLASAFDAAGGQDWSKPGLTSSVAAGNPSKYSIGYAYGGDTSAMDAAVTIKSGAALPATRTIARVVLAGDANMDGNVNFFDITQLLGYKYNTGALASYTDGDLNYDGKVDFFDLSVLLSANYNTGETYLGSAAGAMAAPPEFQVLNSDGAASIPEPAGFGMVAIGAAAALSRRGHNRRRGQRQR
jgi:hypothetical protein